MIFQSLRFKLTAWYVLILAVLLVSFSSFLYFTLSNILYNSVDNKLRTLAGLIASESTSPLSSLGFGDMDQALQASMDLKPIGKFIQVLDESGRIGQKSDNLKNVQLPVSLNALRNASKGVITFETSRSFGNTPLRIVTLPVTEGDHISRIVQVASSLEDVENALNTLFIILIITVPSALVLASLGGQFLANKALKPVDNITQTARLITSQNLSQRITPPKVKDEISRLIGTFNEMISRLDKSFQQIKQFSSDASHELKTPLTILRGEVEVALRKERGANEYEQILRSNLEEINRMSTIVEDLLLLSKSDSGEVPLHRGPVLLTEIVDDVVGQVHILAQAKQIRLQTSNSDGDVTIFGDALRLRQLLLNLIENGIKYTPEKGSVSITLQRENNRNGSPGESRGFVNIIVSDTGIGIDKKDHQRIFDRFYRVDKARSREQGGSGLGLSISKWIVEAHHGEISVESELGKGSSFIVKLPVSTS